MKKIEGLRYRYLTTGRIKEQTGIYLDVESKIPERNKTIFLPFFGEIDDYQLLDVSGCQAILTKNSKTLRLYKNKWVKIINWKPNNLICKS